MPLPPEIMILPLKHLILPLKHLICNTAAFAAKNVIVVYGAWRIVGDSLKQIEITVLCRAVRIVLCAAQTAGAILAFLYKFFEKHDELTPVQRMAKHLRSFYHRKYKKTPPISFEIGGRVMVEQYRCVK